MLDKHLKLFHRLAAALFAAGCLAWLGACADELTPDDAPGPGPHVAHVDEGGGVTRTAIDASAQDVWIYLDLDTRAEVAETGAWDVAFLRFNVKLAAGAQAAILPGVDFAALEKAPITGFQSDAEGSLVFAAGDGWYRYDPATHLLSPRDTLYVIRSSAGAHFKLQMTGYYDAAGTAAHPSFRWAAVAAPPASDEITVEATSQTDWKYLRIADGAQVGVEADWDLAFRRTQIATHGGASAEGHGGARLAEGVGYDDVLATDTVGFSVDAALPLPGPPGAGTFHGNPALESWYDYGGAGAVSSKGLTYVVRSAGGGYGKLTITGWSAGVFTVRVAPIPRRVAVHTLEVTAPAHVDLRRGVTVGADAAWDLRLDGLTLATNSGASGPGAGGASDPEVADLDDLVGPPTTPFSVDDVSGNPILNGWYDGALAAPKDNVYLIRTADGGLVKLEIAGYAAGVYTLRWSYAGAGAGEL